MKKSTILILLIVYLGSILIVGIFGMKAIPFEQLIYCEKITPTSVTTTSGKELEIKQQVRDGDVIYYVVVPYEENLEVLINYTVTPSDSTNKDVKITIVEPKDAPATVTERGSVVFTEKRSVHLVYKAEDSATGPQMDFWIYFR